jgi:hypothetical protein
LPWLRSNQVWLKQKRRGRQTGRAAFFSIAARSVFPDETFVFDVLETIEQAMVEPA